MANVVHRSIEQHAATQPQATALMDSDRSLTYRELNSRANVVARHLIAGGLRRGSVVLVRMDRSTDLVIVLLAILKAGAAYCWLDPERSYDMPRGVHLLRHKGDRETMYLGLDISSVLNGSSNGSSPNLPILTRGTEPACVLPDELGNPTVPVPHAVVAASDFWSGLTTGAALSLAALPTQVAA